MQSGNKITICSHLFVLTVLLGACKPATALSGGTFVRRPFAGVIRSAALSLLVNQSLTHQETQRIDLYQPITKPTTLTKPAVHEPTARTKTGGVPGKFIGPAIDCDGDGLSNESRIDFDGDGNSDECVIGVEEIPEPPFQQTYLPTAENFYRLLPAVGWSAQYQCDGGLYEFTLRRPSEDQVEYSADGVILSSSIVYDDIDPNLNQPLIIQDPEDGVRYSFQQAQDGEFYEYAIANYTGNIGLYIYQTGEQIVAAPCDLVSESVSQGFADTPISQLPGSRAITPTAN